MSYVTHKTNGDGARSRRSAQRTQVGHRAMLAKGQNWPRAVLGLVAERLT
jgi:hypothetical protein